MNDAIRKDMQMAVNAAKKTKTGKAVSKAVSSVDKAAKNKILHKNKAARMKSVLSKIAKPASSKSSEKVPAKKSATKKKSTKK